MRIPVLPLLFGLSLLWPVTGLSQSSTDTPGLVEEEVVDTQQTVAVGSSPSDRQIETRLADILGATGWYGDVSVKVDDGIVFLDGTTTSERRQDWVRDLAAKTDGVVAVVNRIRVDRDVSFSLDPAALEIRRLRDQAIAAAPSVVVAILILPLAFILSRLMGRFSRWALRRRIASPFLRDITARMIALPVFLLGLYIVLQVAGLTQLAFSLIGGAGILGIVIGFAFRDIAENFLASILLSLRQPFRRGDFVQMAGHGGVVHSMNTRSTVLVSPEGNHIQIPNAQVFKSTIENFTASASRRGSFDVGVGYDAPIGKVQDIVLAVLTTHEAVSADPEPMVLAETLGAATVTMRVYYWFDGTRISPLKLQSALLRLVKKALMEANISLPDEAREVIFPHGIPLTTSPDVPQPTQPTVEGPPPPEPDTTPAEADLTNEVEELEDQMATPVEGDQDDDLLQS